MKKYKKIICIIEFLLIIILLGYLIFQRNNSKDTYKMGYEEDPQVEQEQVDCNTVKSVSDNSVIPTIESCINKYMSYITENDKESIFEILDNGYKKNNNINSSGDIKEHNEDNKEKSIKIREIYVKNDSINIEKFYVRFSIKNVTKTIYKDIGKNITEELPYYDSAIEDSKNNIENEDYIIVKLDYKENVYTVEPIKEEQFKSIKDTVKE